MKQPTVLMIFFHGEKTPIVVCLQDVLVPRLVFINIFFYFNQVFCVVDVSTREHTENMAKYLNRRSQHIENAVQDLIQVFAKHSGRYCVE